MWENIGSYGKLYNYSKFIFGYRDSTFKERLEMIIDTMGKASAKVQ